MPSQDQNESFSLQSWTLALTLTSTGGFMLYSYLRAKNILSKVRGTLRDYSLPSKNANPEVCYGGTSFYIRIPRNSIRKTLFGYGPKTQVSEIEIEILNKDRKTKSQFLLTKDCSHANLQIFPGESYSYKWRTREDDLSWSDWSDSIDFASDPLPFKILPGVPSRERCLEIIESIKQGVCFNALVVGKPGAGKSKFINRLASAISGSLKFLAKTAPGGVSTTQRLKKYELIPGKAFVWDMFGWESNFGKNLFKLILEGQVDDVSLNRLKQDFLGSSDARNAQQTNTGKGMPKIDVVFLVMAATDLEDNSKFHQKLLDVLRRLEIPCIGILTKVDSIVPKDQPVSLEAFWEDSRVITKCQQVDLPLDTLFPLANPPSSWDLKVGVDEMMLQILRIAQEMVPVPTDTPQV